MKWIIQDNIFNEAFFDKLLEYLNRMDIPFELVKCVPFTGDMLPEPIVDGPAIAIGSYSYTNKAKALGWKPGSWTNENFDYRVWSEKWKGLCLNEPALVCNFADVPKTDDLFFLRPCADDKIFTGCVYSWNEYNAWKQKINSLVKDNTTIDLHHDTPVVVAEPKHIVSEYRFVVVNSKVITGSLYRDNGRKVNAYTDSVFSVQKEVQSHETELLAFVDKVVATWTPADVFVVDIALHDGQYYVLEMGNFNSAGLYACDIQKIINALEDFVNDRL